MTRGRGSDCPVEVALHRELPFLHHPDRLVVVLVPADVEPEAVVHERARRARPARERGLYEIREVEGAGGRRE